MLRKSRGPPKTYGKVASKLKCRLCTQRRETSARFFASYFTASQPLHPANTETRANLNLRKSAQASATGRDEEALWR
jgi:hypothetical protein